MTLWLPALRVFFLCAVSGCEGVCLVELMVVDTNDAVPSRVPVSFSLSVGIIEEGAEGLGYRDGAGDVAIFCWVVGCREDCLLFSSIFLVLQDGEGFSTKLRVWSYPCPNLHGNPYGL